MTIERSPDGQRIHDAESVLVLIRLNEIQCMLDQHALRRRLVAVGIPRNARERHLHETGHPLALGCCAPGRDEGGDAALAQLVGVAATA